MIISSTRFSLNVLSLAKCCESWMWLCNTSFFLITHSMFHQIFNDDSFVFVILDSVEMLLDAQWLRQFKITISFTVMRLENASSRLMIVRQNYYYHHRNGSFICSFDFFPLMMKTDLSIGIIHYLLLYCNICLFSAFSTFSIFSVLLCSHSSFSMRREN